MNFYYASYGKPADKWESFDVSEDMDGDTLRFFESAANSCTPQNVRYSAIISKANKDCLYRFFIDLNHFCLLHVNYEGVDSFDRPKMVSRGILGRSDDFCEIPENVFKDIFLRLDNKNNISVDLKTYYAKEKSFCNTLMKWVYLLLSSKSVSQIYLVYNDDAVSMAEIACLIYSLLPHALRTLVSFSNIDSSVHGSSKQLIFSSEKPVNAWYVNLNNGETNLLTEMERFLRRKSEYPSYEKLSKYDEYEALNEYFENICNAINKMNLQIKSNEFKSINIADKFLTEDNEISLFSDFDLKNSINILFADSPIKNDYSDSFIARLLEESITRKIVLPVSIVKRGIYRKIYSNNEKYKTVIDGVLINSINSENEENCLDLYFYLYLKSQSDFIKFAKMKDTAFLAKLFVVLSRDFECAEDILQCFKIWQTVNENFLSDNIYLKIFIELSGWFLVNRIELEYYKNSLNVIQKILTEFFSENSRELYQQILCDYWNNFDFEKFQFSEEFVKCLKIIIGSDRELMTKSRNCYNVALLINISDKLRKYLQADINGSYDLQKSISRYKKENSFDSEIKMKLDKKINEFCLQNIKELDKEKDLLLWYTVYSLISGDSNPFEFVINSELPVLFDCNLFYQDISQNKEIYAKEKIFLKDLKAILEIIIASKRDFKSAAKANLKLLEKEFKSIAETKKTLFGKK